MAVVVGPGGLDGAADGGEELGDARRPVGDAGEALGGVGADDDRLRGDGAVDVGDGVVRGAAAVLDEEVDGALGGDGLEASVHAALVALGGLRGELVAAGGLYARMWADYNKAVRWKISSEKEAK